MGIGRSCCPHKPADPGAAPTFTLTAAKLDIEDIVRQDRAARTPAPLLVGLQNTFKSAADIDIDSSSSPLQQDLINELGPGSGNSSDPA
jgi:hypothetical protein